MVLPPPQRKKLVSLPSKVLNTNKNSERVHFYNIMVAQQAGGDFNVVDRERIWMGMTVVLKMQVTWAAMLKNAKLKV